MSAGAPHVRSPAPVALSPSGDATVGRVDGAEHVVATFRAGECARAGDPPPAPGTDGALAPGCAVVVCTYRRAASVERFLTSLAAQERRPAQLLVVDASPDDATERALRALPDLGALAACVEYLRVDGPLRGLTRQRNLALRLVSQDLVTFFDDDVVLLPGCLAEMERVMREGGAGVVGVGAVLENERERPSLRWRARVRLRVIPSLEPGRYHRCGMSTPWSFLPDTQRVVRGDWLMGGATMWRTGIARRVTFAGEFHGYSSGEDLDFSLRMGAHGALCVAGAARALHLPDASGRPEPHALAYMSVRNAFHIHRRSVADRTRRDTLRFYYAFGATAVFQLLTVARPPVRWRLAYLAGYARALVGLLVDSARALVARAPARPFDAPDAPASAPGWPR